MTTSHSPTPTLPSATAEENLRSWGQISAYVLDVEQRELWQTTAPSFTQWVTAFAKRRDRTPGLIWRFLSAGRFYRSRMAENGGQQGALPDLPHLPAAVSADSLELLEKLSRVAPAEVLKEIEPRTLRGKATRQELRAVWQSYRPLMEGRTARGKNVEVPRFDAASKQQFNNRAEADCLVGLRRFGASWAGHPDPSIYELYPVLKPIWVNESHGIGIDLVAVIQPKPSAPVEIHGIQVKGGLVGLALSERMDVQLLPELVDFAWMASPEALTVADVGFLRPEIGVLTASAFKVAVVRPAKPVGFEPTPRDRLTRELLLRALRS